MSPSPHLKKETDPVSTVVFLCYLEFRTMGKVHKFSDCVILQRQNPLYSTFKFCFRNRATVRCYIAFDWESHSVTSLQKSTNNNKTGLHNYDSTSFSEGCLKKLLDYSSERCSVYASSEETVFRIEGGS
jgi:hypothetical protein